MAAVKNENGDYIHQWEVVSEVEVNEKAFCQKLDSSLKEANKNYGVARSKALKGINVKAISKETYHDYIAQGKKKGGQIKTPKVMDEERMQGFLNFIQSA